MQPDFTEWTFRAQRAQALGGTSLAFAMYEKLNPDAFHASLSARWIQGMWTFSLLLSLLAVFLAILAKQWIAEYSFRTRAPATNPRYWNLRQAAFSGGLEEWHLGVLISALPVVLVAALFLFMTGLALFMITQHVIIACLVVSMTVSMGGFYIAATLAPLWYGNCPTYTPLLGQLRQVFYSIRRLPVTEIPPPAYDEASLVGRHWDRYIVEALDWVVHKVPAGEEVNAALDAFGAVDLAKNAQLIHDTDFRTLTRRYRIAKALRHRCDSAQLENVDPASVSRILRTALVLNELPTSFNFHAISAAENSPTHDIYVMTRQILPNNIAFGGDLSVSTLFKEWYQVQHQTVDPCHHRTVELLAQSQLCAGLPTVADAVAFWMLRMSVQARVALLNRLQDSLEQPMNSQYVPAQWRPMPRAADVWLRSVYIFGSLLASAELDALSVNKEFLIRALDMAWSEVHPDTKRIEAEAVLDFLQLRQSHFSCLQPDILCVLIRTFGAVILASLRDNMGVSYRMNFESIIRNFKHAAMKEEVEQAWIKPEWGVCGDEWTSEAIVTASAKHALSQIRIMINQTDPLQRARTARHHLIYTRQVMRGPSSGSLPFTKSPSLTDKTVTASTAHSRH